MAEIKVDEKKLTERVSSMIHKAWVSWSQQCKNRVSKTWQDR